jgi:hypothetical protein
MKSDNRRECFDFRSKHKITEKIKKVDSTGVFWAEASLIRPGGVLPAWSKEAAGNTVHRLLPYGIGLRVGLRLPRNAREMERTSLGI